MPHVGKNYPVAPARDFSKHVPDFHAQVPLGLMLSISGAVGVLFSNLNGKVYPSGNPGYDYNNGTIGWQFLVTDYISGTRPFYATWTLTHDEGFGRWDMRFDEGGFCPPLLDQGTPSSISLCNSANWVPPGVGGCFGFGGDFGSGTNIRPMTWAEAEVHLGLPLRLRF
jgi:hypothetical protein